MYRCTECYTEYAECPDFCDCGNDTFEEFFEEEYYEPEPEVHTPKPKKKLTPEEAEELRVEQLEKKKSLITAGVVLFLAILIIFVFPPHKKKKMEKVKQKVAMEQVKIPSVDTFWDSTVQSTYRKTKDPLANLPLLNLRFRYISPTLREYLVEIGGEFDRKWDKSIVQGHGEAKVEFTIDKEGTVVSKRIVGTTHNESLDNSVLVALSKIISFNIPPDDYKGERIYISFKVGKNGDSHVIYPNK